MTRFTKNPDEIVLEDVKMFHYEVMEEGRATDFTDFVRFKLGISDYDAVDADEVLK